MTIISRDTGTPGTACVPSPGQRNITRPGAVPRVGPAAATAHGRPGHNIERMDQPQLDLLTSPAPAPAAEDRPWIYERVLALVVAGRVWTDNRRRNWLHTGGQTTANRMPTEDQAVLAEVRRLGYVRVDSTKVDMDVPDGRTLRVRRYLITATGAELHARWAALSTYTA